MAEQNAAAIGDSGRTLRLQDSVRNRKAPVTISLGGLPVYLRKFHPSENKHSEIPFRELF